MKRDPNVPQRTVAMGHYWISIVNAAQITQFRAMSTPSLCARRILHMASYNIDLIFELDRCYSLLTGHMCPMSHPHPCMGGKRCSSSPWKPPSGPHADCDGSILEPEDNCCPEGQTRECNANPDATCKKHPHFGKWIKPHLVTMDFKV